MYEILVCKQRKARKRSTGRFRDKRFIETIPYFRCETYPSLPGPSRRLAPVIKCNAFLCFQSYIVGDISLTEIYRWLVNLGVFAEIYRWFRNLK